MASKVKENHKRLAIVSEALEHMGEATSKQLAAKTNMLRLTVQQTLGELKRRGLVVRGDNTGTGNEAVWYHLKPFINPTKPQIDWSLYYKVFHNIVKARK